MADSEEADFQVGSSIPVLRMLDETAVKTFYLDVLGYQIDWEQRFDPDDRRSALYLQIHLGASILHLNGHADESAPRAVLRIPVTGLQVFYRALAARASDLNSLGIEIEDPRDTGNSTDLSLVDPSGNLIVFWERNTEGE